MLNGTRMRFVLSIEPLSLSMVTLGSTLNIKDRMTRMKFLEIHLTLSFAPSDKVPRQW